MAPDFEYFLRLAPEGRYGHTLQGALVLTLPLALFILLLFHVFVKEPLIALFPSKLRERLKPYSIEFRFGGLSRLTLIIASTLVVIFTHILWDSFTHRNTLPYRAWPFLRQRVNVPLLRSLHVYNLLQHGSTIFGVAIISAALLAWWSKAVGAPYASSDDRPETAVLGMGLAIALLGGLLRAAVATHWPFEQLSMERFVGFFVITTIAVAWWELVAFGIWKWKRNGKAAKSSGS